MRQDMSLAFRPEWKITAGQFFNQFSPKTNQIRPLTITKCIYDQSIPTCCLCLKVAWLAETWHHYWCLLCWISSRSQNGTECCWCWHINTLSYTIYFHACPFDYQLKLCCFFLLVYIEKLITHIFSYLCISTHLKYHSFPLSKVIAILTSTTTTPHQTRKPTPTTTNFQHCWHWITWKHYRLVWFSLHHFSGTLTRVYVMKRRATVKTKWLWDRARVSRSHFRVLPTSKTLHFPSKHLGSQNQCCAPCEVMQWL